MATKKKENDQLKGPETVEARIKKMSIYEKILNIQNEVEIVSKSKEVGIGKGSYKATTEADVLLAIKSLENKYRVLSYPMDRTIVESELVETGYSDNKKIQLWHRIRTLYMFINLDNTMQKISTITYSDGLDSGDKGPGKAMTYGDKYALMKMYKIITGEDPDAEKSGDMIKKAPKKADLIKSLCDARSYFVDKNIDIHTEEAQEWIKKAAKIQTTDDSKLNIRDIESLLDIYRFIAQQEKDGYKLPFDKSKLEKAVENADNQEEQG